MVMPKFTRAKRISDIHTSIQYMVSRLTSQMSLRRLALAKTNEAGQQSPFIRWIDLSFFKWNSGLLRDRLVSLEASSRNKTFIYATCIELCHLSTSIVTNDLVGGHNGEPV